MYLKTNYLGEINCESKIDVDQLFFILYLESQKTKDKLLECFNKQHEAPTRDLLNIKLNLSNKKFKKLQKISYQDNAKKQVAVYSAVMSFKYDIELAHKFTKQLKKFNNILARLLEAYLYMISGNYARSEYILLNIMEKELLFYALTSDMSSVGLEKQTRLIIDVIKKFENELSKPIILENLIFYLYSNSQGYFKKKLADSFSIKDSSQYIRKGYKSIRYGRPYPFVWGPSVFEKSSQVEYDQFLEKSLVGEKLGEHKMEHLLFFRALDGIKEKYKSSVLREFKKLGKVSDSYSTEVFFRVVDDESFFKFVNAHSKVKIGLVANRKRKFYRKQVEQMVNLPYAVYNLIQLGDVNWEDLLKVMAFEQARL